MRRASTRILCLAAMLAVPLPSRAVDEHVLDPRLHHLRIEGPREWAEFPESPEAAELTLHFSAIANATEAALRVRQQDVRLAAWTVVLNGTTLGNLRNDENDMVVYFPVPPGTLADGENVLRVAQDTRRRSTPDDIRVGDLALYSASVRDVLSQASLEIEVVDEDGGLRTPCRITVLNADGALQSPGAESGGALAVRPGTIYTSTGRARFGLPPGEYTILAGRGFEYSLARSELRLRAGQTEKRRLAIRREVPTLGYVACDSHLHAGEGDASVEERMITLAGEGIELPVATDHNAHTDYRPSAKSLDVLRHFTPVIGNEVTTRTGHFCIFPVAPGAEVPDAQQEDWRITLDGIFRTPGVKIATLNHPRDKHGAVRPFGPELFNAAVGENIAGWHMGFNAMEVLNSGATKTDPMQYFRDWMALLNRGRMVTPVGASDSHDVARFFPGQARTYIRCDDADPGSIDIDQAVDSFVRGRVMVSYGLLAQIQVNGKYTSGDLAVLAGEEVHVEVRVLGPAWARASKVRLFANGALVREIALDPDQETLPGIKATLDWQLPRPQHDVHLVAIATGPGINAPYWRTAKPYQPDSTEWESQVVGCSGAVWLEADGDGRWTPPYEYARRLLLESGDTPQMLVERLADFDQAVAAQTAHLLYLSGTAPDAPRMQRALTGASEATRQGFQEYVQAWKLCEAARAQ